MLSAYLTLLFTKQVNPRHTLNLFLHLFPSFLVKMTENRIVLNMYLAQSKQDIGRDITDQMQPVCRG